MPQQPYEKPSQVQSDQVEFSQKISRRDFIKAAGAMTGGLIMAACSPSIIAGGGVLPDTPVSEGVTASPTKPATATDIPPTATDIPPTATATATAIELPPPTREILLPSDNIVVTNTWTWDGYGWYDDALDGGKISLYDDPELGKLIKSEITEDRRKLGRREAIVRALLTKRGEKVTGEEYVSIEMPFVLGPGFLPERTSASGGYVNIISAWSNAPPKDYDNWVLLPLVMIQDNHNFALNAKDNPLTGKEGFLEYSGVKAETERPYVMKVIYDSSGQTHLLIDDRHILSVQDRESGPVDLVFFHGGGYARNVPPSWILNGEVKISVS